MSLQRTTMEHCETSGIPSSNLDKIATNNVKSRNKFLNNWIRPLLRPPFTIVYLWLEDCVILWWLSTWTIYYKATLVFLSFLFLLSIAHCQLFTLDNSVRHGLGRPNAPWAGPPVGLGWAGIVRNEWALDGPGLEFWNCMNNTTGENNLY